MLRFAVLHVRRHLGTLAALGAGVYVTNEAVEAFRFVHRPLRACAAEYQSIFQINAAEAGVSGAGSGVLRYSGPDDLSIHDLCSRSWAGNTCSSTSSRSPC